MIGLGLPDSAVARELGVSRQYVRRVRRWGCTSSSEVATVRATETGIDLEVARAEQARRWETVRVSRRCLKCGSRVLWDYDAFCCINCGAYYS